MLKINTLRFGELEVSEDQLFHFPRGLLGFGSNKSFVIIELDSQKPFKWMQSVDDPSTAFVLGDPLHFHSSYCAGLRRGELSPLGEFQEEDLVLSVIMTISERPEDITANLCAPLIFNLVNRYGMQYVLNDQKYPVRYKIFQQCQIPMVLPFDDHPRDARSLSLR